MSRRSVFISSFSVALLAFAFRAFGEISSDQINATLGLPLFSDDSLWDDKSEEVASRIGWPQESQTATDSSYRIYPRPEARVAGTRPYSMAFYAQDGLPSSLSMVFANKGDVDINHLTTPAARSKRILEFKKEIQNDKKIIAENLEALFGPPVSAQFGQSRDTREYAKRWDWKGHAFLLAAPRDEYVILRILPVESADSGGKSRIPDSELRTRVNDRVEKRANGDVVLRDIPMVDQGPKGYCVPATWERVMRYMGVPADMYVLAMAGKTDVGGGTSINAIATGAKDSILRSGRRLTAVPPRLKPMDVANYIDRGLPLMWAMFSTGEYNHAVDSRIQARLSETDPQAWKSSLATARKAAKKFKQNPADAHVCMIIGYNKTTGELAVSDSWGERFKERWISEEEAEAVSQKAPLTVIEF